MSSVISIDTAALVAARNLPSIEQLKTQVAQQLCACPAAACPDAVVLQAFDALIFIDLNTDVFAQRIKGVSWGFAPHDARFLHDLRDQMRGVGQAQKDLTRRQLKVLRNILSRDPCLTQLAALGLASPITD